MRRVYSGLLLIFASLLFLSFGFNTIYAQDIEWSGGFTGLVDSNVNDSPGCCAGNEVTNIGAGDMSSSSGVISGISALNENTPSGVYYDASTGQNVTWGGGSTNYNGGTNPDGSTYYGCCAPEDNIPHTPPKPTVNIGNACTGTDGTYWGNDITVSWANTSPSIEYVDLSFDPYWSWWVNKYIGNTGGATSTTALSGFTAGSYIDYRNTVYVRTWDGSNTSPNSDPFTIPPCAPPKPTVNIGNACTGTDGRYTGNDITVSWANTNPSIEYVDLSSDPYWSWWVNKYIGNTGGATSTTALSGFTAGSYLVPGKTWFIRTWNGYQTSANSVGFQIPACSPPTLQSLQVSKSGTNTFPNGRSAASGNQGSQSGSDYNNPIKITVNASAGSTPIKQYYVGFYNKTRGAASSIDNIKTFINQTRNDGFLLAYGSGIKSGDTGNNYYVWDPANNSWVNITNSFGYNICSGTCSPQTLLYTAYPISATSWKILFNANFGSKDMYTAAYVVDNNNLSAFNSDIVPVQ